MIINIDILIILGLQCILYLQKVTRKNVSYRWNISVFVFEFNLLHDFGVDLLIRVCYPKRSPKLFPPLGTCHCWWTLGLRGYLSPRRNCRDFDTRRFLLIPQVVLLSTLVDRWYCDRLQSIHTSEHILN